MKITFFTILMLVVLAASLYGQSGSINNTLGTSGLFTIKDGSTTFLSLSQSSGYLSLNKSLSLPATTGATIGVIFKGTDRFIHDYKASGTDGFNTFVGVNSGNFTMSGGSSSNASYNTSVGHSSLASLTTGFYNSAFGSRSLFSNTTGYQNSAFGVFSLSGNTSGIQNSAFGYGSLAANIGGNSNSAFGLNSLNGNTTGINNTAVGYSSLLSNITGNYNTAVGNGSLSLNTVDANTAVGYNSLNANITGTSNTAVGYQSLSSNTYNYNTAVGYQSLSANTGGSENSAFGYQSLTANQGNHSNSAFGSLSLRSNISGHDNSAFGRGSLNVNTVGYRNSAFGMNALFNSAGDNNTGLGVSAGSILTTGSNNTIIGSLAQSSAATISNEITLGNSSIATLRCQVTTITALSDARDKKNIRDLPLGVDFLMSVKPRLFNWDRREWYENGKVVGSKMQENPTAGFIAQELDEAQTKEHAEWLNLVLKSNPDRLEATPGNLLPIMVKAIQELKSRNDALRTELVTMRASIVEQVRKEVRAVLLKAVQPEEKTARVSLNTEKN